MPAISAHEREKYEQVWSLPAYSENSPGERRAEMFMEITGAKAGESVLDLGCGAGRGGLALAEHGLNVAYLDFVRVGTELQPFYEQSLWNALPSRNPKWDYGYCCDVMEHIPPEFVMLVVSNALQACRAVFFSISFTPDNFGRFVGEPLHLTVKPYVWWRDRLGELGDVVEARDLLGEGVFYVR